MFKRKEHPIKRTAIRTRIDDPHFPDETNRYFVEVGVIVGIGIVLSILIMLGLNAGGYLNWIIIP